MFARSDRTIDTRLDKDVSGDPPAECNLHAVDEDEKRPAECAATGHPDDVSRVNTEMIQPLAEALPGADVEDARLISRVELVKCHA